MGKIIDIKKRIEKRKDDEKIQAMKDYFIKDIKPYMTYDEKVIFLRAIDNHDYETYKMMIRAAVYRHVMIMENLN